MNRHDSRPPGLGLQLAFQALFLGSTLLGTACCLCAQVASSFVPDPASVERYGPAYRYPQSGWIVLHIEGEPYERGYQHGRLMAPEISAVVRAAAINQSPKAMEDGWQQMRLLTDALFLRRYESEYLLEMKGIAAGAAAAGARFEGRPVDFLDIVAVNAWTEMEFLEAAMRATPNGLETVRVGDLQSTRVADIGPSTSRKTTPSPERCSAFIATVPATRDGKIVFGHITMWSLQPARHFNVWLDLKPARGHRVLMQSFPGGIQSSMDYYLNDAGMLVSETTIGQTGFNAVGQTEASRIRKALQYGSSIDEIVEILKKDNNGLYSNEWLVGDMKTNEIAMFELGTSRSRLWRSSRGEWFGDTPGFYWGCNNTKDLDVRLETVPNLKDRPVNVVFRPSDRDLAWQRLYAKHRGMIDASFGFEAFTTPPLSAAHSLDAKFTTADLARQLKTYALFGPPLGRTWLPTESEVQRFGDNIRPLVSNGWTLLESKPPAPHGDHRADPEAVDLAAATGPTGHDPGGRKPTNRGDQFRPASGPAWHGTILPTGNGDVWLAAAFADYERIVTSENNQGEREAFESVAAAAANATNLAMFPYRTRFLLAARSQPGTSLAAIRRSIASNEWYGLASGRGVFALADLRSRLGHEPFVALMDVFGKEFAGKTASTADFQTRAEQHTGQDLSVFFERWIRTPGAPTLTLRDVTSTPTADRWRVKGTLDWAGPALSTRIELAVETVKAAVTHVVSRTEERSTPFEISSTDRPRRLVVDPFNRLLKANGGAYSVDSFQEELNDSLIVYGTGPERASLQETAELLQRRIATAWSNFSVPIKADVETTDADLKSHHLLLVGRPTMNSLTFRYQADLPVQFGTGSFRVAGKTYAHAGSAAVVAAANPTNPRYSIVAFVGLSAESTRRVVQTAPPTCEVWISPARGDAQSLVLPARDLTVEFPVDR